MKLQKIDWLFILIIIFFWIGFFAGKANSQDEIEIHCIMGEARGEGLIGMTAIAEAMRNRGTLKGVYGCKATFSEPNWVWRIARQAWLDSYDSNLTKGATHWESTDFVIPYWVKAMDITVTIGKHVFYKEK